MPAALAAGLRPLSAERSQLVFRAVLDALARPGTIHQLPAAGGAQPVPPALMPMLALADLSTTVCVLADDPSLARAVRAATLAPIAGLAHAQLVAALRPLDDGELGQLRTGTAAAPEHGALACLAVRCLQPGTAGGQGPDSQVLRLAGPGVPGARELRVTGLPPDFVAGRRRLVAGHPAGADLLMIAPGGELAGLPRTTLISEEMA
jgi:alpha-D-ribose 1-methylphosphonate 5-triphosphate synthase subunit PhnH